MDDVGQTQCPRDIWFVVQQRVALGHRNTSDESRRDRLGASNVRAIVAIKFGRGNRRRGSVFCDRLDREKSRNKTSEVFTVCVTSEVCSW